jgi:hypothetical protein
MKKSKNISNNVNDYITDAEALLKLAKENTIGVTDTKKWLANVHLEEMTEVEFGHFLYRNRDMISKTNWIPIIYKGDEVLTCGLAYTTDNVRAVNDTATTLGQDYFWSVGINSLAPQRCYKATSDGVFQERKNKKNWINKITETKMF